MINFLITALGLLLTSQATSDNQRAIGAAITTAGLSRTLTKMEM